MKIGLVTPYVYPLPGGVNDHVRHLYEELRLRGHQVRIISSSHGFQKASEGDVVDRRRCQLYLQAREPPEDSIPTATRPPCTDSDHLGLVRSSLAS